MKHFKRNNFTSLLLHLMMHGPICAYAYAMCLCNVHLWPVLLLPLDLNLKSKY